METIYDVFKQQVTAQTDAVAVMDEKKCLTYGQLDAMATEIANGFQNLLRLRKRRNVLSGADTFLRCRSRRGI